MNAFTSKWVVGASALLLVACGGGGGGGSSGTGGLSYSGNVAPAAISTGNAAPLAAGLTDDSLPSIPGELASATGASAQLVQPTLAVTDSVSRKLAQALPRQGALVSAASTPIDQTIPCTTSGSVRITGSINDDGTGTLLISFNNCTEDGDTLNGSATLRVDAFNLIAMEVTDATLSFSDLTLTRSAPPLNMSYSGTIRVQRNFLANTETVTVNALSRNNLTGLMKQAQNLVIVNVYDNLLTPTTKTVTLTGRLYDSVHGYVDISTTEALVYTNVDQERPDSGVIILTGAAGRSIRIEFQSSTVVVLQVDYTGDAAYDLTVTINIDALGTTIGDDLADTDGDGMHNSWETFYGLNPTSAADALLDTDSDGYQNLAEYLAGSDPTDPSSTPLSP